MEHRANSTRTTGDRIFAEPDVFSGTGSGKPAHLAVPEIVTEEMDRFRRAHRPAATRLRRAPDAERVMVDGSAVEHHRSGEAAVARGEALAVVVRTGRSTRPSAEPFPVGSPGWSLDRPEPGAGGRSTSMSSLPWPRNGTGDAHWAAATVCRRGVHPAMASASRSERAQGPLHVRIVDDVTHQRRLQPRLARAG